MRGLATDLCDKAVHQVPVQLGRVGWGEVVCYNDVRLVMRRRILRSLAEKMPNDTSGDILDIHNAFPEIGVIDGFEGLAIFAGYLLEDVFDAEVVSLQATQHLVDECAVLHNE